MGGLSKAAEEMFVNGPARRERQREREMEREMEMEEVSGGAFICLFGWFLWEGVGLGWVGGERKKRRLYMWRKRVLMH